MTVKRAPLAAAFAATVGAGVRLTLLLSEPGGCCERDRGRAERENRGVSTVTNRRRMTYLSGLGGEMSTAKTSSGEEPLWMGRAPCGTSLQVGRDRRGLWQVVYGGFSRAGNLQLRVALAEATGATCDASWLAALEQEITATR